jgi:hypothetical protein
MKDHPPRLLVPEHRGAACISCTARRGAPPVFHGRRRARAAVGSPDGARFGARRGRRGAGGAREAAAAGLHPQRR